MLVVFTSWHLPIDKEMLSMPWNEQEPAPPSRCGCGGRWRGLRLISLFGPLPPKPVSVSASWSLNHFPRNSRNKIQIRVYIIYSLIYGFYLCVLCKSLKPDSPRCNKNDVSIAGGDTLPRSEYDRWDDLPCLVNCSEGNWITLKLEQGWEGEGHAGVILLEQDAEKSNLLWSDSLKAKNKLTGGSLGSLAAWSQYFIINDNKKKKGGRKGIWVCAPIHPPEPAWWLTIAQTPGFPISPGTTKGSSREKEAPGKMKNG